jgi:transglutaminase-like putative cysteine protease
MAAYKADCEKVRIQITTPDATTYTYVLPQGGSYQTFPLSGGDGRYQIQVLENISGDSYAVVLSQEVDVQIENEFLPYLYPNQYVNFTADSKAVAKGAELSEDAYSDLDVVNNIYHYVIENITYDTEKAESVTYGYLPDVDETLASGTGICFDYASLMSCMLRSQGIPTKLEVGYSGDALHSWISTYIDEIGWVDNIIEFDGESWQLLDPTLAANNDASSVGKYIGDGTNYTLKYTY